MAKIILFDESEFKPSDWPVLSVEYEFQFCKPEENRLNTPSLLRFLPVEGSGEEVRSWVFIVHGHLYGKVDAVCL